MKRACMLLLLVPMVAKAAEQDPGTVIVVDKETEVGLYLSLWPDEAPASFKDLPLRGVDEPLRPLDAQAFRRANEQEAAKAAYRREQLHRSQ